MLRRMMPHQTQAFHWLWEHAGGALFMQMRLGKTLVCIRYVQKQEFKRVLVVAPLEGIWAWKRELEMEEESYVVLHGMKKEDRIELANTHRNYAVWCLINYESLLSTPELFQFNWDCIILDESRRVANPKAKVVKLLHKLPNGPTRIALSGEPAPETPLEYFEQYRFLYGKFMGCRNFWEFRNRYFQELAPHEFVPNPKHLEYLKASIQDNGFFLSRKQAGIPDKKIYEVRTVQLPDNLRKMYNEVLKDFVASLDGKPLASTKWVPVQYLWLQQIASGWLGERMIWPGKGNEVLSLLQGELKHEQVVIWFRFNPALRDIYAALTNRKIPCAKITGEESRETRETNIDNFRRGNVRVLLCQVKCGKTAIDLSTSSTAIYYTNSYSLEERKQSEDRILNPKKREPLLYLDLVTEKTVEEDILEVLRQKSSESKFFVSRLLVNAIRKEGLM